MVSKVTLHFVWGHLSRKQTVDYSLVCDLKIKTRFYLVLWWNEKQIKSLKIQTKATRQSLEHIWAENELVENNHLSSQVCSVYESHFAGNISCLESSMRRKNFRLIESSDFLSVFKTKSKVIDLYSWHQNVIPRAMMVKNPQIRLMKISLLAESALRASPASSGSPGDCKIGTHICACINVKSWLLGSRGVCRHPYCRGLEQRRCSEKHGNFVSYRFGYFVCFYIRWP